MIDVDKIAEKVANEPLEEDVLQEDKKEVPQHVIDEAKVDAALERMREQREMDMFNSEDWNWSGLR